MRVSMLFSKRLVTLVIPSSFFPITASDPPHLSLLSVQRVDLVRGGGRRGCPKATSTGLSQIDLMNEETGLGDSAWPRLTSHWWLAQV